MKLSSSAITVAIIGGTHKTPSLHSFFSTICGYFFEADFFLDVFGSPTSICGYFLPNILVYLLSLVHVIPPPLVSLYFPQPGYLLTIDSGYFLITVCGYFPSTVCGYFPTTVSGYSCHLSSVPAHPLCAVIEYFLQCSTVQGCTVP